jgi:hypothetical protein
MFGSGILMRDWSPGVVRWSLRDLMPSSSFANWRKGRLTEKMRMKTNNKVPGRLPGSSEKK